MANFLKKNAKGIVGAASPFSGAAALVKALKRNKGQQGLSDADIAALVGDIGADENLIRDAAGRTKALRKQGLDELAGILAGAEQRSFAESAPQIAEDANAGGFYTGTGYSDALAKERAKLAAGTRDTLATAGLANVETDIGAENAALDRRFSLLDYGRELKSGALIGQRTAPRQPGLIGPALTGAVSGAVAGAPAGPGGAAAGAGVGAIGGAASARGK